MNLVIGIMQDKSLIHRKFHYQTNNAQENNLLLCVGSLNEFNLLENPSFAVQRNEVLFHTRRKELRG